MVPRASGGGSGSLSILSSYHRVQRRKEFAARSQRQEQQQQWRHGSGNSSQLEGSRRSSIHSLPLSCPPFPSDRPSPQTASLSRILPVASIALSLSPRLAPSPPLAVGGAAARGVADADAVAGWWKRSGFEVGSLVPFHTWKG